MLPLLTDSLIVSLLSRLQVHPESDSSYASDGHEKPCQIVGLPRPGTFHPKIPQLWLGGSMFSLKILPVALAISAAPLITTGQQLATPNEIVDKLVAQEQVEMQVLSQYFTFVTTYNQSLSLNNNN